MRHVCLAGCIGSAFNAKGEMQCPNCRSVAEGTWQFGSRHVAAEDVLGGGMEANLEMPPAHEPLPYHNNMMQYYLRTHQQYQDRREPAGGISELGLVRQAGMGICHGTIQVAETGGTTPTDTPPWATTPLVGATLPPPSPALHPGHRHVSRTGVGYLASLLSASR
eukprot:jgi/Mesen1/5609/ME000282S04762